MDSFSRGMYYDILRNHSQLAKRKKESLSRINDLENEFKKCSLGNNISVYCSGSIGRGEVCMFSDLDLFVLSEKPCKKLEEIGNLATIIEVNKKMGYSEISNDGRYLKVYSLNNMLKVLGEPTDDSENLFTARMLMILESRSVYQKALYKRYLTAIVEHYFRDKRGKRSFRPLFFLNDLLRFWRTLCLNYEMIRDDPNRPWRKKNINLKFSRMLTIFGTVLPVIAKPVSDASEILRLTTYSPHERFAIGLDMLNDSKLREEYELFLDNYEKFLCWKEKMEDKTKLDSTVIYSECTNAARQVSDFLYSVLCHDNIEIDLKKYLVI